MLCRLYTVLLLLIVVAASWTAFDDGWKGFCALALFLAFQIRFSDIKRFTLLDAMLSGMVIILLLFSIKPACHKARLRDNGYFYHETLIAPDTLAVEQSENPQINWHHYIGFPLFISSSILLAHRAYRSRRAKSGDESPQSKMEDAETG